MNVLLVTYDLKQPAQNYTELYDVLKTAPAWWHYLESTWLLSTNENPQEWYHKLVKHIYKKDRLLIIEVKPSYYGWLSNDAWEWIQKYLHH